MASQEYLAKFFLISLAQIKENAGGKGVSSGLAQAKACGYVFTCKPALICEKIPRRPCGGNGDYKTSPLGQDLPVHFK